MASIIKIKTKLDDAIGYFVGGILLVMAFLIALSVGDRLLKGSIAWVEEIVRSGVVWTTFLGSYVAIAKNKDIKVDIVIRKLPPKAQTVCTILSELLVLVFLYVFVQLSFVYVKQFAGYTLPMTGMTRGLLYSVFPIGSVLMAIHYVLSIIIKLRELFNPSLMRNGKEETQKWMC